MLANGLDKLGQFPLIQLAIGFLIVIGGLMALRQGSRDKKKIPPPEVPEQRWYFDGPVAKALEALSGIFGILKEIRRENDDYAKERRDQHKEHMQAFRDLIDRLPARRR